ncbi:MAG: regulatory protein MerR [Pseudonocardiales bacterium]|nr:regulatory protein MerR [Pseudonocardiales bacterium]
MTVDDKEGDQASETRGLSVGVVAARLGVASGTVRSWGRRYGLAPSGRTIGGHRRFTLDDLNALLTMQALINDGQKPAAAAREVLKMSSPPGAPERRLPHHPSTATTATRRDPVAGQVLAVPGSSPQARRLARIASRLDADAAMGLLAELFIDRGAVHTWDNVLRPVLRALGEQWANTGHGIDTEHVLSEATINAVQGYRSFLPRPAPGRPVLLAAARTDQHTLPVHILAAALAERRIPVLLLGSQVPPAAMVSAARRTGASGLFIWRQLAEPFTPDDDLADLARFQDSLTVVTGGPGWTSVPTMARPAPDAATALTMLAATAR